MKSLMLTARGFDGHARLRALRRGARRKPTRPSRCGSSSPTSPGGGNDFVARHVGQRLSERLGQQFIVENRAGAAAGPSGPRSVAKAPPDGYTLLLGFVGAARDDARTWRRSATTRSRTSSG